NTDPSPPEKLSASSESIIATENPSVSANTRLRKNWRIAPFDSLSFLEGSSFLFCRISSGNKRRTRLGVWHTKRPGSRNLNACFRRSEEHTSELQSRSDLVCRLLLEKK